MAEGFGAAGANTALDALLAAYPWIKLHVGAPGSAGTSNAATETTRKQATWTSAASGAASNSNALTWTAVAGSEDYTHFTAWTASSGGTFGFSGTITAAAVTAGQTFTIAIGDLDPSLTLAS
jgi:CO/xanthine dehydrogenase Mo-binding subunit